MPHLKGHTSVSFEETVHLLHTTPQHREEKIRKGTIWGSTFTLCTCAVGSGVLSLPYAFSQSGLVLGPILLIIVSFITLCSLNVLLECAEHTGKSTYQDVALAAFGPKSPQSRLYKRGGVITLLVDVTLLICCFGSLVGYLIIIGELLNPVACYFSGHVEPAHCLAAHHFWTKPDFLSAIVLVIAILPLAFLPKFHNFAFSSLLAVASVIFLAVVVLIRAIPRLHLQPLWNLDLLDLLQVIPLFAFALGCHIQVIPIYSELSRKGSSEAIDQMGTVTFASNGMCTLLYLLVSSFGYLHYGTDVAGNVLDSYNNDDILATLARLFMAAHVTLAFPLVSWPCRNVLHHILFGHEPITHPHYSINEPLREQKRRRKSKKRIIHTVETLAIVFLAFGFAIAIPSITIVFGFIGAVGSTLTNFILPAAFSLKLMHPSLIRKVLLMGMIIFGIMAGIGGVTANVFGVIKLYQGPSV